MLIGSKQNQPRFDVSRVFRNKSDQRGMKRWERYSDSCYPGEPQAQHRQKRLENAKENRKSAT